MCLFCNNIPIALCHPQNVLSSFFWRSITFTSIVLTLRQKSHRQVSQAGQIKLKVFAWLVGEKKCVSFVIWMNHPLKHVSESSLTCWYRGAFTLCVQSFRYQCKHIRKSFSAIHNPQRAMACTAPTTRTTHFQINILLYFHIPPLIWPLTTVLTAFITSSLIPPHLLPLSQMK